MARSISGANGAIGSLYYRFSGVGVILAETCHWPVDGFQRGFIVALTPGTRETGKGQALHVPEFCKAEYMKELVLLGR
jgi:hypothetical protein